MPEEITVIITILGTLIPILAMLGSMTYWLWRKFALIEARFREIDKRFEAIDKRFDEIKSYIDSRIVRIAEAFRSYQEFFIEYLSYQGIIRAPLEADMLKREASRMMKLATMNPLTKEEWEKIKYYLEKDQLTLEEALEFRELARKVTDEYGDRPEAWKLHILASIRVGEAMRRMKEEMEKKKEKEKQEKEGSEQEG
ncbi:MAG TPA: hypothetical protein VNL13_03225 [Sulfolobales archaeon]|nr:hypothetical protein [Sulfolobales archaeon]